MANVAATPFVTADRSPTSEDSLRIAHISKAWLATFPGQRLWTKAASKSTLSKKLLMQVEAL